MKKISLFGGLVALVDDEDFDKVSASSWYPRISRNTTYAQNWRGISMHRFIMGCVPHDGVVVDHEDLDGLNNQKGNLRKSTVSQNATNRRKHVRKDGKATSKYKGVSAVMRGGKTAWAAAIAGTRLGVFAEEVDAATAYNFGAEERYGVFAGFNV